MNGKLTDEDRELRNKVYHYLRNKDGHVKSSELEEEFAISGAQVRACIHDIRVKAYPIISDNNGYKFARSADEIEQCVSQLYSRVGSIAEAARGLVACRDKYFSKQVSLEFEIIDEVTEKLKVLNNDHLFKHQ